jgi:hypothetical protein
MSWTNFIFIAQIKKTLNFKVQQIYMLTIFQMFRCFLNDSPIGLIILSTTKFFFFENLKLSHMYNKICCFVKLASTKEYNDVTQQRCIHYNDIYVNISILQSKLLSFQIFSSVNLILYELNDLCFFVVNNCIPSTAP